MDLWCWSIFHPGHFLAWQEPWTYFVFSLISTSSFLSSKNHGLFWCYHFLSDWRTINFSCFSIFISLQRHWPFFGFTLFVSEPSTSVSSVSMDLPQFWTLWTFINLPWFNLLYICVPALFDFSKLFFQVNAFCQHHFYSLVFRFYYPSIIICAFQNPQ